MTSETEQLILNEIAELKKSIADLNENCKSPSEPIKPQQHLGRVFDEVPKEYLKTLTLDQLKEKRMAQVEKTKMVIDVLSGRYFSIELICQQLHELCEIVKLENTEEARADYDDVMALIKEAQEKEKMRQLKVMVRNRVLQGFAIIITAGFLIWLFQPLLSV